MRGARLQQRLFAHHTVTIDVVDHPAPIRDPPVPREQLDRPVRAVFDPDVIDPEPFAGIDARLFGQEIDRDPHGHSLRHGSMLEELFHSA